MNLTSPPQPSAADVGILGGYQGVAGVHDELLADDGRVRPHWQPFVEGINQLGLHEFSRRWREAQELIRENGVTYNVYGDPRGLDRPWQLDPVPFLISAQEGDGLREALVQRARLLEAI